MRHHQQEATAIITNSAADFIIITHAIQDPKNVSGSCDSYVIVVNHAKLVRPPLGQAHSVAVLRGAASEYRICVIIMAWLNARGYGLQSNTT